MHTTTRLGLDIPDATDLESAYPGNAAQSMGILDNAAIFKSGTLAGKPNASLTVNGTIYYCTDTGALLLCMANTWVWANANTEPIGTIKAFAGISIPADPDGTTRWRLCDGATLSRTTYASLFTAISTTWGIGDGATTFGIPNFESRIPVGAGTGPGLSTRTVGQTGGEEGHLLLAAESGTNSNGTTGGESGHTHVSPAGFVGYITAAGTPQPYGIVSSSGAPVQVNGPSNTGGSTGHTHALAARNADSLHNNMQPFAVTNYIIKYQ